MIEFNNVSFAYGENVIADGFSLRLCENGVTALLGASGCGKTTLLNLIAGLLKPSGGVLTVPQSVSYVFQEPRLIPEKTVFSNLDFILKAVIKNKNERRNTIKEGLKAAGLEGCENQYPSSLSGGMAQRVSLLRAFLFPSEILLLDEPFKGLDEEIKKTIITTFFSLYENNPRTVVLVTHDRADASALADTIVSLGGKPLKIESIINNGGKQDIKEIF